MSLEIENADNVEAYIDESDGEGCTPEEMLERIENAWLNEKFAPDLLPQQIDLVELALSHISHMQENINKVDKDDIRRNIHTMEISRIRFMISSYLRRRLEKIEEFAIYLLENDATRPPEEESIMTTEEIQFAKEYISGVQTLFHSIALQNMPKNLSTLKLSEMATKPNLDKHVFVRANEDISGILLDGNEEVDFIKGSQHIIRYRAIAPFVLNGKVQLI